MQAGVLMLIGCPIWTVAGAQGGHAELGVVVELGPLCVSGFAIVLTGTVPGPGR